MAQKIKDKRLLTLLRQMMKVGYVQDWKWHSTYSGVPQGGVISPLLSNIFLNELDKFVEKELIPRHSRGVGRRRNNEYFNLSTKMSQAKARGDTIRYKQLASQRRQTPRSDPHDPIYRRLAIINATQDRREFLGYEVYAAQSVSRPRINGHIK